MEQKFEYFEKSRNLKSNYYVNDKGEKEGIYVEFSEDGFVQKMLTYKNNIKQGEYREYSKYGKLKEIGTYQNGVKTGEVTKIIANGALKGVQENGILQGDSIFCSKHADGKLKDKIYLRDNKIVGAKIFDRQGNLKKQIKRFYENKNIIDEFINYGDQYIEKGTMVNFKLEGIFQRYLTEDNSLYQELNYQNGKLKEEKLYRNRELIQSKKTEKSKVNEKPLKIRERTRTRGQER